MILLTFATDLEIVAIGVITKQGKNPDIIETLIETLSRLFPIRENTTHLALFITGVAIFKALMLFTHRFLTKLIVISLSRDLRQRYFEHIQSQDIR